MKYDTPIEMTHIISRGDSKPVLDVTECVENYIEYFKKHRDRYGDRGIDSPNEFSREEMTWFGMVDALRASNDVAALDHRFSVEDIFFNLDVLINKKKLPIDVNQIDVTETFRTSETLEQISQSEVFLRNEIEIGVIDTGSDEFCVFLIGSDELRLLNALDAEYVYYINRI
jgi:hypothetical protein